MKHHIKIQTKYYERIILGQKDWELRKNDRDYQVGDIISFELFEETYMAYEEFEITYILQGFSGIEEGYCIFSIKKLGA